MLPKVIELARPYHAPHEPIATPAMSQSFLVNDKAVTFNKDCRRHLPIARLQAQLNTPCCAAGVSLDLNYV